MTAGLAFLSAVVSESDDRAFDSVSSTDFVDTESSAFVFISNHLTSYGSLPSVGTCRENNIAIQDVQDEGVRYYHDRLISRSVHNAVTDRFEDLTAALTAKNNEDILSTLHDMLDGATRADSTNQYSTLGDETTKLLTSYQEAKYNPDGLRGIPFGFPTLDGLTMGALPADLIAVVARPGIGKSWKLIKMMNTAHRAGYKPLVVSMEMSIQQMVSRCVGETSGLNPKSFRSGDLCFWSEEVFTQTLTDLEGGDPIHFLSGDGNRTALDVEKGIRQFNPDVVYVDAAYLLKLRSGRRVNAKWERVAEIMQDLKGLAMTYNIPIIMTVQFNREVRSNTQRGRTGAENIDVGSIAGTDEIAQLASLIIGILMGDEGREREEKNGILMKNREGEVGNWKYHTLFEPTIRIEEFNAEEYAAAAADEEEFDDDSAPSVADTAFT